MQGNNGSLPSLPSDLLPADSSSRRMRRQRSVRRAFSTPVLSDTAGKIVKANRSAENAANVPTDQVPTRGSLAEYNLDDLHSLGVLRVGSEHNSRSGSDPGSPLQDLAGSQRSSRRNSFRRANSRSQLDGTKYPSRSSSRSMLQVIPGAAGSEPEVRVRLMIQVVEPVGSAAAGEDVPAQEEVHKAAAVPRKPSGPLHAPRTALMFDRRPLRSKSRFALVKEGGFVVVQLYISAGMSACKNCSYSTVVAVLLDLTTTTLCLTTGYGSTDHSDMELAAALLKANLSETSELAGRNVLNVTKGLRSNSSPQVCTP